MSTSVSIRPGLAADLPMVFRAERDYIRDIEPAAEAGWTRALDKNLELWVGCLDRTIVAEDAEGTVGFAMWMPHEGAALLVTIQVLDHARRRGVGNVLLQRYLVDAGAAGHRTASLGVHASNPARRLYEAAGFRHSGDDGDYALYELRL
ncbi:GNAT family N-acetyltransferase [Nocardioides houyundeii]|uniref:GNAT family N-acetyltransferase n=1 Tax=Nocardioides houyundeii TaxID=2045452 RepID=UPI0013153792|nr:GNAT family N-acetyltransferase [Nocardioides houyundeii]